MFCESYLKPFVIRDLFEINNNNNNNGDSKNQHIRGV